MSRSASFELRGFKRVVFMSQWPAPLHGRIQQSLKFSESSDPITVLNQRQKSAVPPSNTLNHSFPNRDEFSGFAMAGCVIMIVTGSSSLLRFATSRPTSASFMSIAAPTLAFRPRRLNKEPWKAMWNVTVSAVLVLERFGRHCGGLVLIEG